MTPRHRRLGVLVGIALLLPTMTASGAWADALGEKKAEAVRLQAQLERQGAQVSILAEKANRARLKVSEVEATLARTQTDVARSDERLRVVRGRLAQAAVLAYVHGGSNSLLGKLARGGPDDMVVRTQYLRVTAADQRQVIGEVRVAREDFVSQQARLESDRKLAAGAASQAATASDAASGAESAQRAVLSQVRGEVGDLVAAEQARAEAEAARNRPVPAEVAEAPRGSEASRPQQTSPSSGSAPQTAATPQPAAPPTERATPTDRGTPTPAAPQAKSAPAQASAPPASSKGAAAVAEARKHLGKPYVYGGSGPDNFDCSGLTSYAWRAAGVNMSHSAYTQWFETTRVPVDAVQPGDLLFFGPDVEGIHHNAIYIGDGNMIEASQTGTPVRIRGWRSVDLVGAGRPG